MASTCHLEQKVVTMLNKMVNRVNILHPHGLKDHLDNFAAKQ